MLLKSIVFIFSVINQLNSIYAQFIYDIMLILKKEKK